MAERAAHSFSARTHVSGASGTAADPKPDGSVQSRDARPRLLIGRGAVNRVKWQSRDGERRLIQSGHDRKSPQRLQGEFSESGGDGFQGCGESLRRATAFRRTYVTASVDGGWSEDGGPAPRGRSLGRNQGHRTMKSRRYKSSHSCQCCPQIHT